MDVSYLLKVALIRSAADAPNVRICCLPNSCLSAGVLCKCVCVCACVRVRVCVWRCVCVCVCVCESVCESVCA